MGQEASTTIKSNDFYVLIEHADALYANMLEMTMFSKVQS